MPPQLRVLIVEDSDDDAFLVMRELQRGGLNLSYERVDTLGAMKDALEKGHWDLLISDYSMPGFGGPAALKLFQRSGLDIPFIFVSGRMGEDLAVEMMKAGAHDYVMKNNLSRLVPAVNRELNAARERRARKHAEATMAHLASIVQSCHDAIFSRTLDGTVMSWNAAAERLFGYIASEMIGRSSSVLTPPNRAPDLAEIPDVVKTGERLERFETVRLRKDGTPISVSLTVSPVHDAAGDVIGASIVARNISQRKLEEEDRLKLIHDLTTALAHGETLSD